MVRDKVTPAGALDEALERALTQGRTDLLGEAESGLAAGLAAELRRAVAGQGTPEEMGRLGATLAEAGFIAAAIAAHAAAVTFGSHPAYQPVPSRRAHIHAEMAALLRAGSSHFAADAHLRAARRLRGEPNSAETLPELDDGSLMVLSAFNDADGHGERWSRLPVPLLEDDPLRDPTFTKRHYLAGYRPDIAGIAEDFSFFVMDDDGGEPVLLVECDALGDRFLGCREAGILLTAIRPDDPRLAAAQALALRQLDLIAAWAGCPHALLDLSAEAPPPAAVSAHLGRPADLSAMTLRNAWIDLDRDAAAIESGYRPTTRQRVRWGRENVRVARHGDAGIDIPALYDRIRAEAGRDSGLPAPVLAAALADGRISAFVGFHREVPAAIVLTSRHGGTTYDMATARIPGDNAPLCHILIHHAILDARAQGRRRFDFGPLYEGGEAGAKMKSIAEFKSGFASAFERRLILWLRG